LIISVQFYTDHIQCHTSIVTCEFCYNLHKTMWQGEWRIRCSSWVGILCTLKPKNPKRFSKKPQKT